MTEAMPFLQKYDITFLRPPTIAGGDLYLVPEVGLVRRYWGSIAASPGNSKSIHWILFALRDVPFESRLSLINIKKRVRG